MYVIAKRIQRTIGFARQLNDLRITTATIRVVDTHFSSFANENVVPECWGGHTSTSGHPSDSPKLHLNADGCFTMPVRLPIPAVRSRRTSVHWSSWTRQLWRTLQPPGGGGAAKGRGRGGRLPLASLLGHVLVLVLSCQTCLAECPDQCSCIWRGGKETVECKKAEFILVPKNVDPGTQVLDMGENNLQMLPKDTFLDLGLVNLQKILLQRCNLMQIDKEAFRGLTNLVELDVSHNLLGFVPHSAFLEANQLRRLFMNNNPLQRIQVDAFSDMPSLEMLELSQCQIAVIEPGAFNGTNRLIKLKLDGNRLETLSADVVLHLTSLHQFHLHDNPWKCDCQLRSLRQWMTLMNVPYIVPPTCSHPPRFQGRTWSDLRLDDYACEPTVTLPATSINVLEGDNITFPCRIFGNPEPEVRWWHHGAILDFGSNVSSIDPDSYSYVLSEEGTFVKTSNLTIAVVDKRHSGMYSCVAENYAGTRMANITLTVGHEATEMKGLAASHITGIVVGIAAVIVLFIVVLCVLTLRCKHAPKEELKKADSNHKMVNNVNHQDPFSRLEDQDLSLLGPNPIQKPPRLGQYQSVPTIDLDHYDEYRPNSTPAAWKTQVVVELAKRDEDFDKDRGVKVLKLLDEPRSRSRIALAEEEDGMCLRPIVEEVGGTGNSRESEEGDDSGLELDRGRETGETEVRSDVDSDKERLQEKNRKNQSKRAPISLRDSGAVERELIGGTVPGLTREKLRQSRPVVQRGGSAGGGDSTCSSSDPPTVPSSPQRQSHGTSSDPKGLALVVPSVLLTRPCRSGRPSSFEDEGEDGTEV